MTAPGPQQEALSIALIMREALEEDVRTAALITPDRRLARRVAAELRRWGIEIDDSAGIPLADTVPGVFLRLTADAVTNDAGPVALLAALKHPLAAGGLDPSLFRKRVRQMEIAILRGPRPAPGFQGLHARVNTIELEEDLTHHGSGHRALQYDGVPSRSRTGSRTAAPSRQAARPPCEPTGR